MCVQNVVTTSVNLLFVCRKSLEGFLKGLGVAVIRIIILINFLSNGTLLYQLGLHSGESKQT
jgi:hypothetical protein